VFHIRVIPSCNKVTKNVYNVRLVINTFNRMPISALNLKILAQCLTYSWLLKLLHYIYPLPSKPNKLPITTPKQKCNYSPHRGGVCFCLALKLNLVCYSTNCRQQSPQSSIEVRNVWPIHITPVQDPMPFNPKQKCLGQ